MADRSKAPSVPVPVLMQPTDVMPQDRDAECAVLGASLMSRTAASEAADVLREVGAEAFVVEFHRQVWTAILTILVTPDEPIDLVTARRYFARAGLTLGHDMDSQLVYLAESFGDWANAGHYAKRVLDSWKRRKIWGLAYSLRERAHDHTQDADDVTDSIVADLEKLSSIRCEPPPMTIDMLVSRIAADVESGESQRLRPTGFPSIDRIVDGFVGGDFVIVGARPSHGKTAFALSMTMAMLAAAEANKIDGQEVACPPTLFVTMEMSARDIAARAMSIRGAINLQAFRRLGFDTGMKQRLGEAAKGLRELPLHIRNPKSRTVGAVSAFAAQIAREQPLGMIVVDYIGLMFGSDKAENRQVEVSRISAGLKQLAMDLDIPVIALSQINRAFAGRKSPKPQLSDLRESGAVEQDADIVFLLYRAAAHYQSIGEPLDPNAGDYHHAEVNVAKMRNGRTGSATLGFIAETASFCELDHHQAESDRVIGGRAIRGSFPNVPPMQAEGATVAPAPNTNVSRGVQRVFGIGVRSVSDVSEGEKPAS